MDSFAQARRYGRGCWHSLGRGALLLSALVACGRTNGNGGLLDEGEGGAPSAPSGVAGISGSAAGSNGQGGAAQGGTRSGLGGAGSGVGADGGVAGVAGAEDAGGAAGDGGSSADAGDGGVGGVGGAVDEGGEGGWGGEGGAAEPNAPCVLRVRPLGSDNNDGSSWSAAFATLEGAMRASSMKYANQVCQVWVAEGTYAPTPWSRETWPTLRVPARTEIYGGFVGNERTLAERLGSGSRTIVSGLRGERSPKLRPVLTTEDRTRLDQITIRDGDNPGSGGGIVCEGGELVLNQVLVTQNQAGDGGGLLVTAGCAAQVNASVFDTNYASSAQVSDAGRGAGIANFGGRLVVRGGRLTNNIATSRGGGVYTTGNTDLSDVELAANYASSLDGGPVAGGALYADGAGGAETRVRACTVRGNFLRGKPGYGAGVAGSGLVITGSQLTVNRQLSGGELYGGGVYATGSLTLDDSTLSDNSNNPAGVSGGGVYFEQGALRVRRTTFHSNRGATGAQLRCAAGCRGEVSALFRGTATNGSATSVYFDGTSLNLVNSLFFGDILPLLRVDAPNAEARVIHSTFYTSFATSSSTIQHLAGNLTVESSVMSTVTDNPNIVPTQIHSTALGTLTITKSNIVGICGGASTCGTNWDVVPKYSLAPYPAGDSIVVDAGGAPLPADWLDLDGDGDVAELLPVDFYGSPRVTGPRSDLGAVELTP